MVINTTLIILVIAFITLTVLLTSTLKSKNKNKLYRSFAVLIVMFMIHIFALILQVLFSNTSIEPIYFEYFAYIGGMGFSTAIFIMACTYFNEKKVQSLEILYIIPFVFLIFLWTNDFHHLFYKEYSIYLSKSVFGPVLNVFMIYSYVLIGISFLILLITSIKKSGFVSKQTLFIILGLLCPLSINMLGVINVNLNVTVYATPILFTATSVCFYIAIFRLKALNIVPVAFNTIIDSMSDAFVVVSEDGTISDLNKTFIEKFKPLKELHDKDNLFDALSKTNVIDIARLKEDIKECLQKEATVTKEYHIRKDETYDKYFEIDFQPVKSRDNKEYVATLLLLRDITTAKKDMEIMMKNESLVTLGELAGGVAHDINTPISAIKSGLLIFKSTAKTDDEKMLIERMDSCADKIITLTNSLRNQIRNIGSEEVSDVNISNVVKDVSLIIHNELTKHRATLNLDIKDEVVVKGNSAKLSQVVTNIVVNAIQAYDKEGGVINLSVYKSGNDVVISVEDFAGGIPEHIRDNIGKNILTTKGVSGTGFGLYLAYSVIKGAFGGEIRFDSETGKGTTFYITLPLTK